MLTTPILLHASDLNDNGSIACPNPKTGFRNETAHPRVFLSLENSTRVECPYCGSVYELAQGEATAAH